MNDLEKKLKKILAKTFGCKIDRINSKLSFGDLDSWDSMNHYKMASEIEKVFKINFSQDEIETLVSYKIILSTVKSWYEK